MGSSKSAQALMCKFNYEQKDMNVLLLKPDIDNRGDADKPQVRSRIGLVSDCGLIHSGESIVDIFNKANEEKRVDCIIIDEAQFCNAQQIFECKVLTKKVPVLCYGLMTTFRNELFEGSKRLVELSDSLSEIKSVCRCGRKATINARFINGKCVDEGPTVFIGGDEAYENMCYWCWREEVEQGKIK